MKNQKPPGKFKRAWKWMHEEDSGLPFFKYVFLAISALSIALFLGSAFTLITQLSQNGIRLIGIEDYGSFGSFLAGTLGSAIAAFALMMLYSNLRVQMREFTESSSALRDTAEINKKSLKQQKNIAQRQEHFAKQQAERQRQSFILNQVDKQLERMEQELKNVHRQLYTVGDPTAYGMIIRTADIFGKSEPSANVLAEIKNFDKAQIKRYITQLSFMGYDTIQFLELDGKYHHRASQFDKLMSLLEPFNKRNPEIIELLAPLDIPSGEFWTLAHTYEKISELRHMQENEIKTNLINKKSSV